jgi:drug/metabolite transporter (DMT)-like permease
MLLYRADLLTRISASLQYLPVAEATVITFLAPTVAGFACMVFLKEPFTKTEQWGGYVSLLGVVLIARPSALFAGSASSSKQTPVEEVSRMMIRMAGNSTSAPVTDSEGITVAQRLSGVGFALVGVFGAACAYTTLRWIGKRAHPLVSVNYFGIWCSFVSTVSLLAVPSLGGFKMPHGFREWGMLAFLGVCGFCMVSVRLIYMHWYPLILYYSNIS